ncbi:hypothetical protein MPER_05222 [Moniliophthora perniciosa FA553]|nr:hypothetical protein MPER_05222 [Moniliophthora perniciosa FA553]
MKVALASSTNTKSEAQQKKKKWVLFTKSHKKDKVPDVKENGHASAPSPPISTSDTNDASPSGANESHSPQLHEQQCVGSNSSTPKVPSRPNTPKALNTEALKRPDLEQLHLALSDLGKVNTFFAPGPDPVLTPSTGRSTYGPRTPRTPGGTIIPNHLFTPVHLVDREVYLEQLYRKRVTAIDDDASWWDDFKKRPLSLVPELAEGMGDDDSETIAASTVGIVSVDDAIAMDLASIEALNLGGLVPHDPNGDYIFFTVDADWDPQSGEDATCFLVDHPFEVPPSSVAMSYADEFDRGACHLVVETTSIHKPNPIDEMTDEELDMCHELVHEIGLAI